MGSWLGISLAEAPRTRTLDAGEALFRQGDPVHSFYQVTAGALRLVRHTDDGSRVLLHTARAGETLAEPSLFADAYHCDAIAAATRGTPIIPPVFPLATNTAANMTVAKVLVFPRADIVAAMTADPRVAMRVARHLAHQVRDLRARLELRDIRSAQDRLMAWLRLRAQGDPPIVCVDQDWTTVADELALRREVVYRALGTLQRQGQIRRDGIHVHLVPPR